MTSQFKVTDRLALPKSDVQIPQLGFGVYQSHGEKCLSATLAALKAGYTHIDTAQYVPLCSICRYRPLTFVRRYYANEKEVGEAVVLRQSALKRSDVFITTKILSPGGSVEKSYQKLLDSVHKIDGEDGYVDLFLIHSPHADSEARKEMYLALEKLLQNGKTRSIGVSNWGIGHIDELKTFGVKTWPPHVNQIEVSFHDPPWLRESLILPFSSIPSANNGKSLIIVIRTALSSRHTVYWFAIESPTTPHSIRLPKAMGKP